MMGPQIYGSDVPLSPWGSRVLRRACALWSTSCARILTSLPGSGLRSGRPASAEARSSWQTEAKAPREEDSSPARAVRSSKPAPTPANRSNKADRVE